MTTINQSKRLLACGVSPDTADMCIGVQHGKKEVAQGVFVEIPPRQMATPYSELDAETRKCWDSILPAWSLDTLMTYVLPHTVNGQHIGVNYEDGQWRASYRAQSYFDMIRECYAPDPTEVCVRMVEYLHKRDLL